MASMLIRIRHIFSSVYCSKLYGNNSNLFRFSLLSSASNSPNEPQVVEDSKNKVTVQVDKSESLESVLAHAVQLDQSNVVNILGKLSKLNKQGQIKIRDLKQDLRFKSVCLAFEKQCTIIPNFQLVQGLKCVLELDLDPESRTVSLAENELIWKARKMNLKLLNFCLTFHIQFQETNFQKQVVKDLIGMIQRRWIEIASATDVLASLENSQHFQEEFLCKVEDRAMVLAANMTSKEIQSLFCMLQKTGRRPKPLLHALTYHLNQKEEKLPIKQSVDLMYALNSLTFPDANLMHKLTNDILSELSTETKGTLISAIFTSCGKLKWKHSGLLEACCEWLRKNKSSPRQEAIASILALARLNYAPEDSDQFFKQILPQLDLQALNNEYLFNIVWSLAILGKVTAEQLNLVLQPTFYKSLIIFSDYRSQNNKLKLLNMNSVAKLNFPDSKIYSEKIFNDLEVTFEDEKLKNHAILESLSIFLPKGKFMATNLKTSLGFLIDAEFIMDKGGKPLSLLEYGVSAGFDQGIKPIPADCRRFALLVWDYKDLTLCETSPIGVNALAVKLLTKLGYIVVEIHQSDFKSHSTAVKEVQYLQQKIKEKLVK